MDIKRVTFLSSLCYMFSFLSRVPVTHDLGCL